MAQRRMFSLEIIDTDNFLELPSSSQALYFHLGMRADDDGFVSSPKKIATMVNCSIDDLKLLITKKYIIPFDTGVVVIKDWKLNNYIKKDRYKKTRYFDEMKQLLVQENGTYELVDNMETFCNQIGDNMETQVRLGKYSNNILSTCEQVIAYLNQKTGKKFKANTKATQRRISARIAEGYNLEDFKQVIDTKTSQWLNNKEMSKYLRPETLFSTKFESYLNENCVNQPKEEKETISQNKLNQIKLMRKLTEEKAK